MNVLLLLLAAYVPMLVEARRAAANERAQLARGGVEAASDVYALMRLAYPAAFLVMIVEAVVRGLPPAWMLATGVVVFVAAKALKWWAIVTLGRFWTFRVITVAGAPLVASGPYRFAQHPNYVGVVGELAGFALMAGAQLSGPVVTAGFGLLMLKRIAIETRALDSSRQPNSNP